jgi:hypothetical protein
VYGWDCGLFGKVPLGTEWDSCWIGKVSEVWCGLDGISFAESHAPNSQGPVLESRHPMITGATTCPVWNGLLTN